MIIEKTSGLILAYRSNHLRTHSTQFYLYSLLARSNSKEMRERKLGKMKEGYAENRAFARYNAFKGNCLAQRINGKEIIFKDWQKKQLES